jgi:hypothetical protein
MKNLTLIASIAVLCPLMPAQTIEDGIMMGKRQICSGYLYSRDSWDEYWEGARKRDNGNIGSITTESHTLFANYGVTDRLNVITMIPHVSTDASKGVLAGMSGFQDATFAAKYKFFQTPLTEYGALRAIAVFTASTPMTDYTPDFLPLSIGLHSRRLTGRGTAHFRANTGWFINVTGAYTWRGDVGLDRPFFYTDGQLTFSDQVPMPDVFDYSLSSGYIRDELVLSASFSQQRTQGGGDIRRQDAPFVSNRMNFSRAGLWAKVPVLSRHGTTVSLIGGYSYVVDGRNVGQSSTLTAGVMYFFTCPWSRTK